MDSQEKISLFLASFGKRVKTLRRAQKMTQIDLADRSDMDIRQIQRIEAGEINTSIGNAMLIAEGLSISTSELFRDED